MERLRKCDRPSHPLPCPRLLGLRYLRKCDRTFYRSCPSKTAEGVPECRSFSERLVQGDRPLKLSPSKTKEGAGVISPGEAKLSPSARWKFYSLKQRNFVENRPKM
jgi:hypothetical protein